MDGASLTRFPHLSWLHFSVSSDAAHNPSVFTMQGACHTISLTSRGHHDVRWIVGAKESRWTEQIGTVHLGAITESCVRRGKEKGGVSCCDLFTNSSPRRAERIRHPCEVLRFAVRVVHQAGSNRGDGIARRRSRQP